jgi:hypothetical protein
VSRSTSGTRAAIGGGGEAALQQRGDRLRVDAFGAEVHAAFQERGIRCVLLKGRAFADLLYDADEVRGYGDCDLLIAQHDRARAGTTLTDLGFRNLAFRGAHLAPEPLHADHWHRDRDAAAIDLHWRLRGSYAPADAVFSALWDRKVRSVIGGRETWVLDLAGSALLCALHLAQHPLGMSGPRADLERAIARLPDPVWHDAADLAVQIDALVALTDGLRLCPSGTERADRLGLADHATRRRRLSTGSGPWGATAIQWLLEPQRLRDRARLAVLVLFPPPRKLRHFTPLARRGPAGLSCAYLLRPFHVARKAPAALAYRRAGHRDSA